MLSAQGIMDARDALTLKLLNGVSAFGLKIDEKDDEHFDSDGWAWLFLSLSSEYREDYEKYETHERNLCAAESSLKDLLCAEALPKWILPDPQGECLGQFGLGAWFDPKLPTLPPVFDNDRWPTLREDEKYQTAFAKQRRQIDARNRANIEIEYFVDSKDHGDVSPDFDGYCRRRYGLAMWLSPARIKLPLLRDEGSWFFPLKALVLENYNRKKVTEPLNLDPTYPQFPIRDRNKSNYVFLGAHETSFGYRRISGPFVNWENGESLRILWAAVDCSIPVDGQLAVLRDLAKSNRKFLREFGLKTRDAYDSIRLDRADKSEVFEHVEFETSGGCRNVEDSLLAWFAFSVDVLGPIQSQCDELSPLLKQRHEELCTNTAKRSPVGWFQAPLPYVDNGHGGCRLKALHILAELATSDVPPRKMAAILGVTPKEKNSYAYPWHRQFDENIDDYIEKGLQLVNGDYKYLVHGQIEPTDSNST